MRLRRNSLFAFLFASVYLITFSGFIFSLVKEHYEGKENAGEKFQKIIRETKLLSQKETPFSPSFANDFIAAIGNPDEIKAIRLSFNNREVFKYPDTFRTSDFKGSATAIKKSTSITTGDTWYDIDVLIYTVSPVSIYNKGRATFIILLAATFLLFLYIVFFSDAVIARDNLEEREEAEEEKEEVSVEPEEINAAYEGNHDENSDAQNSATEAGAASEQEDKSSSEARARSSLNNVSSVSQSADTTDHSLPFIEINVPELSVERDGTSDVIKVSDSENNTIFKVEYTKEKKTETTLSKAESVSSENTEKAAGILETKEESDSVSPKEPQITEVSEFAENTDFSESETEEQTALADEEYALAENLEVPEELKASDPAEAEISEDEFEVPENFETEDELENPEIPEDSDESEEDVAEPELDEEFKDELSDEEEDDSENDTEEEAGDGTTEEDAGADAEDESIDVETEEDAADEIIAEDAADSEEEDTDTATEENADETIEDIDGIEDNKGLFSPETGFGWESYMLPRLDSELLRAASSQQDISVFTIRIPGFNWTMDGAKEIAALIQDTVKFNDLIFNYKEDGCIAIFQEIDIDTAILKAEKLNREIAALLKENNHDLKSYIGISNRSLRLISGQRIANESEQALEHALEEDDAPVIAFKVNPEKYKNYLAKNIN